MIELIGGKCISNTVIVCFIVLTGGKEKQRCTFNCIHKTEVEFTVEGEEQSRHRVDGTPTTSWDAAVAFPLHTDHFILGGFFSRSPPS